MSMREKIPNQNCCMLQGRGFMERWISVVVVNVQIEINQYINLFDVKSRKSCYRLREIPFLPNLSFKCGNDII